MYCDRRDAYQSAKRPDVSRRGRGTPYCNGIPLASDLFEPPRTDAYAQADAMEYRLLLIFLNHRGQTLTRRQILGCIWDEAGDYVNDNTLSVYIKRLRAKLGDVPEGRLIQTVRDIGYRLV